MDDKLKRSSKGLSFIRVLGRDYSKQLQIPQDFTAIFNGNVPHRFIIESTVTKKCWRVEVEKDVDCQMYFRGGWHDFVESHSLEVGNILIFEYEEESIFHVKVYGRNGCEKTTLQDIKGGQHKLEKTAEFKELGQSEADKCDEKILRKHQQQKKIRELSPKQSSEELRESEAVKCDEKILRNHQRRKRIRELSPKRSKHGLHKKQHEVVKDLVRTAKTSISKNSVSFSITLHKWKKHQFIQLTIPMAVSVLKLQNKEKVMLQNAKGNCWPVKVARSKNGRRIFSKGWTNFIKENGFLAGDTLDFEFISDNLIKVVAAKSSQLNDQVVDHHSEVAEDRNEAKCLDYKQGVYKKQHTVICNRASKVKVSIGKDSVSFSVTLHQQKNYQFFQLDIPKAVSSRQKLWKKEKVMLQDAKGNCWPVKVAHKRDGRGVFTQGWKKFMTENGYTAGDTLNFEFISDNRIQVHATKALKIDPHSEDQEKYQNEATEKLGEDDEPVACTTSDDKAIEDSITAKKNSSVFSNSTFSFMWNEATTGNYLNIPNEVAKAQKLMNKDTAVFRDPEGKCWPLQVRTWWDGRVVLTKGWVEFWKGHAISEGDSLHLEFMPNSLIQVTINRGNPRTLSVTQEVDHPKATDDGKVAQLEVQQTS